MRDRKHFARQDRKNPHGYKHTKTYTCWRSMLSRCCDTHNSSYKYYGGRGIKVCNRWFNFRNFLSDMGEKPNGLTLGRIKNNGNYCRSNCRWETWEEQRQNMRRGKPFRIGKRVGTMASFSREAGISTAALRARIKNGWDTSRLLLPSVIPNHFRKLSPSDGRTILRLFDSGKATQTELSRRFNITYTYVNLLVRRRASIPKTPKSRYRNAA
jgi:hypothetical protein